MIRKLILLTFITITAISATDISSNSSVHISLQGNPFSQLNIDSSEAGYRTKEVPATLDLSFGKKFRFEIGFGMMVKQSPFDFEDLEDLLNAMNPDTTNKLNIDNGIMDLFPLYQRCFKIKVGTSNLLKEQNRFRLNLINNLNIYIFADDIISPKIDADNNISTSRSAEPYSNVEYFIGFEPTLLITENFSLFTRSGMSMLFLDESERTRFRVNLHPFYGGFGLRYSF